MANRRMFSLDIVDSDAFLDMPASSQNLYYHLGMRADDDGFVSNPKKIMRVLNSTDDDLKILVGKRFIFVFDTGICVIKHWKMNNYIQSDRYKPTVYKEELSLLKVKENGSYTELDKSCIQNGYTLETQVRLGKVNNIPDSNESDLSVNKGNMYSYTPIDEDGNPRRRKSSGKGKEMKARNAEYIKIGFLFEKLGEQSTGVKPDLTKSYFIIKNAREKHGVQDFEALFKYFFNDQKLTLEQKVSLAFVCSPAYITQWKVSQKNKVASQVEAASDIRL